MSFTKIEKVTVIFQNIRGRLSSANIPVRAQYLAVSKITDFEAGRLPAVQQRVLQLHIPMAHALHTHTRTLFGPQQACCAN